MITFILETVVKKKAKENNENDKNNEIGKYSEMNLIQVLYLIIFQEKSVLALLKLKNEVNTIYLTLLRN